MFGTYNRLNLPVDASWQTVVRAAIKKLDPKSLKDPQLRPDRRTFYRIMLEHHERAQEMVAAYRL
ncbi:hypothetical protein [Beijerinckia indica]|uniref:Uncharacterized protein n=1 Tax=Beijerinckia indica subsp. indica (strain ATCC 9039 / DSM 1715 / NCIMB 8712) TaxID=395963 RepID=B2IL78_BEII9|nr:hypothetical protein [Beijerinckia indica]ACB97278.1 conserved hypothetical protein [Beijerinckia indica subsp. indica ATCC 9039]